MTGWNPRYVAYARAHDREPEQMLLDDAKRWPGGKMAGFLIWIDERWREWRAKHGISRDAPLGPEDHADFDAWIGGTA